MSSQHTPTSLTMLGWRRFFMRKHSNRNRSTLSPPISKSCLTATFTSPCFSAAACQQGGASYPSMGRALLQARDLTVWMARALGMVQTANMPKLVQLLTELGELERDEWRYTGFGASRHLLALRAAFARVVSAACVGMCSGGIMYVIWSTAEVKSETA